MCNALIAGECVIIEKSMIWYCGHAIVFVQYMPCNCIKQGINVCPLCCVIPVVLIGLGAREGKKEATFFQHRQTKVTMLKTLWWLNKMRKTS